MYMKKMACALLSLACLWTVGAGSGQARPKPIRLVKAWETDTTLRTPESVLYDPAQNLLYVANIDGKPDALDGNGFISTLSTDGKITKLHWASGLNAPKGMGLHGNKLYVTDVYRLVLINTETGQAEKTWDAVDVKTAFLNDVTVAKDGTVYVSDNRNDKLYRLKDGNWEVWMEGGTIGKPNGVLALGNDKLLIGSTKTGALQELDVKSKAVTKLADGMGNTDGIAVARKKSYFVSDWNGQIFQVDAGGKATQLLDLRADKINTADLTAIPAQRLLVVPTFYHNRVIAYRWE